MKKTPKDPPLKLIEKEEPHSDGDGTPEAPAPEPGNILFAPFYDNSERSPLDQAQELMYDAWDELDRKERVKLARKALRICPDCADAYNLLAVDVRRTKKQTLEYYEKAVAAGERALGEETFEELTGQFWGFMETRPYMRARAALAEMLWILRRRKEAVEHISDMLRLNPGDNQGMRYILLGYLLEMRENEEAERLIQQYPNDGAAAWAYDRALLSYGLKGPSCESNRLGTYALRSNPHIPDYLTGKKEIPQCLPAYLGVGDENEAIFYAADHWWLWRRERGALDWLTSLDTSQPWGKDPKPLKGRYLGDKSPH
jgi:tetratricopeptide (TPR) repeat protein